LSSIMASRMLMAAICAVILNRPASALSLPSNVSWTTVYQCGHYGSIDVGQAVADSLFNNGPRIFRRLCSTCDSAHSLIFYLRLTPIPTNFSMYHTYTYTWASAGNILGTDFQLYSSWSDLVAGTNAWTFCNYDGIGIGFPRDCGPTGWVPWQWTACASGWHSFQELPVGVLPLVGGNPAQFDVLLLPPSPPQPPIPPQNHLFHPPPLPPRPHPPSPSPPHPPLPHPPFPSPPPPAASVALCAALSAGTAASAVYSTRASLTFGSVKKVCESHGHNASLYQRLVC